MLGECDSVMAYSGDGWQESVGDDLMTSHPKETASALRNAKEKGNTILAIEKPFLLILVMLHLQIWKGIDLNHA